jgi:hypothetical protein
MTYGNFFHLFVS